MALDRFGNIICNKTTEFSLVAYENFHVSEWGKRWRILNGWDGERIGEREYVYDTKEEADTWCAFMRENLEVAVVVTGEDCAWPRGTLCRPLDRDVCWNPGDHKQLFRLGSGGQQACVKFCDFMVLVMESSRTPWFGKPSQV